VPLIPAGEIHKGFYMGIDKLRDKAALIAFQFFLEHSDYEKEKWIDTNILPDDAWELADRFIEKRGGKCRGCSFLKASMDETIKAEIASGHLTNQGAAEKLKSSSTKKKPPKK